MEVQRPCAMPVTGGGVSATPERVAATVSGVPLSQTRQGTAADSEQGYIRPCPYDEGAYFVTEPDNQTKQWVVSRRGKGC